jgi:hypothetical protein
MRSLAKVMVWKYLFYNDLASNDSNFGVHD